jgi:hypothetical protein
LTIETFPGGNRRKSAEIGGNRQKSAEIRDVNLPGPKKLEKFVIPDNRVQEWSAEEDVDRRHNDGKCL